MKKLIATLMFIMLFSLSVIADGEIPGGGRTCQPPTVPCRPAPADEPEDSSIIKTVKEFLAALFG